MTKREAKAALWAFADSPEMKKRHPYRGKVNGVRHIYTRAYVLAKLAPQCIVVAYPWQDSEPHLRSPELDRGFTSVNDFDPTLETGHWCALGYITTPHSGSHAAVALSAKQAVTSGRARNVARQADAKPSPRRRSKDA